MCKEFGCRDREMQVCNRGKEGRDCARAPVKKDEKDHEAHTESLILQRETMRHLTDWFYPDGGWGWTVVLVAILINLVALGPVLGGGQVLVFFLLHYYIPDQLLQRCITPAINPVG